MQAVLRGVNRLGRVAHMPQTVAVKVVQAADSSLPVLPVFQCSSILPVLEVGEFTICSLALAETGSLLQGGCYLLAVLAASPAGYPLWQCFAAMSCAARTRVKAHNNRQGSRNRSRNRTSEKGRCRKTPALAGTSSSGRHANQVLVAHPCLRQH